MKGNETTKESSRTAAAPCSSNAYGLLWRDAWRGQPRYSPKQLNYVWSVLALDKKKHKASHVLAHVRGWIQAVATILANIHLPNFFKGEIYRGNAKTVCVPGLNCYSCPAAAGACPIGAFQAVVGSSKL